MVAEHFSATHDLDGEDDSNTEEMVGGTLPRLTALERDPIPLTSKEEIMQVIKSRKRGKVPGPDSITNSAIANLPDPVLDHLVVIANAVLRLGNCRFSGSMLT